MGAHDSVPADDDPRLMADRVNIEPPILRGCSSSELIQLAAFLTAVGLPSSVLIAVAIGKPMFFLGLVMFFDVAGIWMGAGWFQRVKRGRPDHFYVHRARLWLARRGLLRTAIQTRCGAWDIYVDRRGT
jgi:conjugative transfer region protein (TIGR03750 family)